MRSHRTRTVAGAALVLAAGITVLSGCGGRTDDGGNPGNPAADTTTIQPATPGAGG